MKKTMFLVMVALMPFVACSSDDDNGGQDPIVGKWQLIGITEIENGETNVRTLNDCEKTSKVEFKVDGTLISEFFYNEQNECVSEGENILRWENQGGGVYKTIYPDGDVFTSNVEFSGETLISTETEESETRTYSYIQTFQRVE